VGVLDLLPQCVSAVYFMYHESVHEHALGKIGALREISLANEEGYRWWYAGFYIHSCVKMRYKGEYAPQYVLDPETYAWDRLSDDVKKLMDVKKYVCLSKERAAPSGAEDASADPMDVEIMTSAATASTSDPKPGLEVEGGSDEDGDGDGDDDEDDDDDDDDAPVPNPTMPLYDRGIPGIMTRAQLLQDVDLDHIKLRIGETEAETCMLVDWEERSLDSTMSIKARIAELVAAVGKDLAEEMVISFS
jgi:arginine-tRNA-protein transferase